METRLDTAHIYRQRRSYSITYDCCSISIVTIHPIFIGNHIGTTTRVCCQIDDYSRQSAPLTVTTLSTEIQIVKTCLKMVHVNSKGLHTTTCYCCSVSIIAIHPVLVGHHIGTATSISCQIDNHTRQGTPLTITTLSTEIQIVEARLKMVHFNSKGLHTATCYCCSVSIVAIHPVLVGHHIGTATNISCQIDHHARQGTPHSVLIQSTEV